MANMEPLADTQRVIDWDELPEQVRSIPEGFNPLDKGVLMKHQVEWLATQGSLVAGPKGRRTGFTFAQALDDTVTASSRKSAGGDNIYYIGDTKEKGLEFVGYVATFARVIAQAQGDGVSGIEQYIFKDQDDDGNSRDITAYRIRFASGFRVVALSSRPANIRGLQGKVRIDEAAFHADVQGVLDAATALLIWGGEIRVISTHNGKNNPFNQLIKDIESGRYGDDAKVYTATFDDAVANGLYERVCLMRGWEMSEKGKKAWYTRIRAAYGPRKAAMREELDAIPRDGGGVCIPGVWIERAMPEDRPVVRLALPEDFALKPEDERRAWCDEWIEKNLTPLFELLDPKDDYVFGSDFARHRDFSIFCPLAVKKDMRRTVPWVIEMHKVPTRQQEQIIWACIDALFRFGGGAMDATGPGQTIAEYTADKFGHEAIHQVNLSRAWYGEHMRRLVDAFEDGAIEIPNDRSLEGDLRAIEESDGIPMVVKARRKDIKDPELYRHGDFAVALALAWYASLNRSVLKYAYQSVRVGPGHRHARPVRATGGFKGRGGLL
tara:strand:- start:246 stop:1895 length:1650 start_codon:yes stop_codon:yes gene_type:complete